MQLIAEQEHAAQTLDDHADLERVIEHAAHLLPAQGPISAFVHHNTLHAFEELPFEAAVLEGAAAFGCHPYLSEEHYRRKLAAGRILPEDIEATLMDDLADRGDELLGFLGTRFHLRQAMLAHPLLTGPTKELRWVLAESEALRCFRKETAVSTRECLIADTRHWMMRDLRNGASASSAKGGIQTLLHAAFRVFDQKHIEQWDDSTWETFSLHLLWLICKRGVKRVPPRDRKSECPLRHRDLLLAATGQDSDQLVADLLIRFCAAFLDQGFAHWTLPDRKEGFYVAFLRLYSQRMGPADLWLRNLPQELRRLRNKELRPIESIAESLELLGVEPHERETYIGRTLLALRGFAGMIWQLETRGDRVSRPLPKTSLVEFLAVRLILDRIAVAYLAQQLLGFRGPFAELRESLKQRSVLHDPVSIDQRAFLVFQLSQLLGWQPKVLYELSLSEWTLLLHEVDSFDSLKRRRIYHLAFERRYRMQTLDAVAAHCRAARLPQTGVPYCETLRPTFQVVCCIDEREESFRRHLEEISPDCETFGAAGFFAVAMYYRGAADAHFTPLCPVVIKPQHYVTEHVAYTFEQTERYRRQRRRAVGTVTRRVHLGSRTFAGGWAAAVCGSLASIPLVMRILFPRTTAQVRQVVGSLVRLPAVTRLQLERTQEDPGPEDGHIGYSVGEMASIVERLLRDMGLTRNMSRLLIVCGHGSSSLNNPHEAAHDCGACSGGRGGPNARAFAQMANDPRVRSLIASNGLQVPADTVVVGAYHNTCDESVTYYDLDRLPLSHKADFERASTAIDAARARNAHERCRRFESAELQLSAAAALRHVEGRAEDLSQVRPEYGHATNALCFVGRREWSRGLFLDRRAFLQSYDPSQDGEDHSLLSRILQAVVPVCAGINLEYYFSYVDPTGYGCGTKLPHNITSLLGIMNGAASDLRPGLPWQMVEIHEPVRLLFIIETTPAVMIKIIERHEGIARLVRGRWVQLATVDPSTAQIHTYDGSQFQAYQAEARELPVVASSLDWYRGWRDHLGFAGVRAAIRRTLENSGN